MATATPFSEVYQHGHHASVVSNHAKRTADKDAAFFLPVLGPGMRLLDVGWAPGETIGIDASESVIDTARSLLDPATANLAFEVGSIYQPRFAPATFDAVFAHQVLQHLRRPVDALAQMRVLLKPDSTTSYADADETRDWANTYAERTLHSNLADKALEYGLATRTDLESMAAAWRAWGDHPDALYCFSHSEVVARRQQ